MQRLIILATIIFFSQIIYLAVMAGDKKPQLIGLNPSSFYNNKTIVVEDTTSKSNIKVKIIAKNKYEPAMSPMYLSTGIRCPGDKKVRTIDLGSILKSRYGEAAIEYLAKPTAAYKSGQIHVCSLDNVNLDENYLMIGVLRGGSSYCDESRRIEFLFPIAELCP